MPEDWSPIEVEAIVTDYFSMWMKELRDEKYNKAEHNRLLQKMISRTRGSIEKKHQNISAVLWHLGYPYIDGYKPLPNYQTYLRSVIEKRLIESKDINLLVTKQVHAPIKTPPKKIEVIQVAPPSSKEVKLLVEYEKKKRTAFVRRNYLEMEERNHSLGNAGEKFILEVEHKRLWQAGKHRLADQIEHVAVSQGDYLGFDILSFETTGAERLIEVKTTRYGELSRFFASANEVKVSEERKKEYHLYRLFNFEKQPKFFVLGGALSETCKLKAVNFSAVPI